MIIRLVLLALVAAGIIYVLRRIAPGLFYNPRMRLLFSGLGFVLLRRLLFRHGAPLFTRLLAALRLFR